MDNLDNYGCAGGMRCKAPDVRMAIPCKRTAAESLRFSAYESGVPLAGATQQRTRQCSQNVQVIHGQPLNPLYIQQTT